MDSPTSFKQQPQTQVQEQTLLTTASGSASSFFSKYKWWLIGGAVVLIIFLIVRWKSKSKQGKEGDAGEEQWDEFANDREMQSQHAAFDSLEAPPISSGLSAAEHAVLQRNRQAHQQQTQPQQPRPLQQIQPQQQPYNGHIGGAMPTQPVSQYPSIQEHVMTPQQPTSPAQHVMPAPQTTYNQPQYTGQIYQGQGQQGQQPQNAPQASQTAPTATPPMMGAGSGDVPFNGDMPSSGQVPGQAQPAPAQPGGFSMDAGASVGGGAGGMPSGFSPL